MKRVGILTIINQSFLHIPINTLIMNKLAVKNIKKINHWQIKILSHQYRARLSQNLKIAPILSVRSSIDVWKALPIHLGRITLWERAVLGTPTTSLTDVPVPQGKEMLIVYTTKGQDLLRAYHIKHCGHAWLDYVHSHSVLTMYLHRNIIIWNNYLNSHSVCMHYTQLSCCHQLSRRLHDTCYTVSWSGSHYVITCLYILTCSEGDFDAMCL